MWQTKFTRSSSNSPRVCPPEFISSPFTINPPSSTTPSPASAMPCSSAFCSLRSSLCCSCAIGELRWWPGWSYRSLCSSITPIVVFLPLISITGVTGTFFRALAVTMTVSLATSLILALSWTPTLSQYLVRRKEAPGAVADSAGPDMSALLAAEEAHLSGFFGRIVDFYARTMRAILKRPWVLAASSVLVVALSFLCYKFLGTDFLPAMDEGGFILDYFTPPGSSLTESNH